MRLADVLAGRRGTLGRRPLMDRPRAWKAIRSGDRRDPNLVPPADTTRTFTDRRAMKPAYGPLKLAVTGVAALVVMILGVALAADASGALDPQPPARDMNCSAGPVTSGTTVDGTTLDAGQIGNAEIIYNVGEGLDLPQQAAIIAIATATQESRLRNLPYCTAESLGLFQQRPSQGWGTPAQIMNPVYASTAFYQRLAQIPGWQALPLGVVAQDVQHSADPSAYTQWQPLATALVSTFSTAATNCLSDNSHVPASGTTHLPAGFTLPSATPAAVRIAIGYAVAQLGKPYIWGGTGPTGYDCSGLVMMAYRAAGIDIPRTTFQQVLVGTPIYSLGQVEPGNLLFTAGSDGTPTDPGHVGMYIGSGLVIQAAETGEPIMITPLAGYWQQNTVAIRRII
jgi:cell wall-associated NlpC family hydrolase